MRLRLVGSSARALFTRLLLACALAAPLALPLRAAAQTDESTRAASARALFQEGVELTDQNSWAQAADRFRRALELRDSPVIAYNLASALRHLDKLVEATELLRNIATNPATDRELRASAQSTLDEVEPRISRVMVHAPGRTPSDDITLDEQPLRDAQIDVAVPIDPGVHVVSAARDGKTVDRQTLELPEGYMLEITLDLKPAPAPREVAALALGPSTNNAAATRGNSDSEPSLTSRWWLWAGAGAVVIGAVVTTLLLTSSSNSAAAPAGEVLHVKVAR